MWHEIIPYFPMLNLILYVIATTYWLIASFRCQKTLKEINAVYSQIISSNQNQICSLYAQNQILDLKLSKYEENKKDG
jgi:hypothetical protein